MFDELYMHSWGIIIVHPFVISFMTEIQWQITNDIASINSTDLIVVNYIMQIQKLNKTVLTLIRKIDEKNFSIDNNVEYKVSPR